MKGERKKRVEKEIGGMLFTYAGSDSTSAANSPVVRSAWKGWHCNPGYCFTDSASLVNQQYRHFQAANSGPRLHDKGPCLSGLIFTSSALHFTDFKANRIRSQSLNFDQI